ncbi:MAG TPA: hypothetical protein VD866_05150 [Urbifossiella sp.]|nr:hypothetical protein [Urbifossiella sp.]
MPPPRRPDDRRDPFLSGMAPADDILDAEVLDADVLDAEVLDADVLDGEILDAGLVPGELVDAEVVNPEPLGLDDGPPAVFDLDALNSPPAAGTTPAPSLPVYEPLPAAPTGADMLSLDVDPPPAPTRTAARPATATRPAVRITFVCPGERSPFDGRG